MNLRPCPFCGNEDVYAQKNGVTCFNCAALCAVSVENWNRRPIEDALAEALKMQGREYPDGQLCFCEMAIGNPMVTTHTPKCIAARAALAKMEGKTNV
jgi:hypothetical protein